MQDLTDDLTDAHIRNAEISANSNLTVFLQQHTPVDDLPTFRKCINQFTQTFHISGHFGYQRHGKLLQNGEFIF